MPGTTYVALLRGVNVNGITIRMADLARVLGELGLRNVRTVLASGNAVFETGGSGGIEDDAVLKSRIEAGLRHAFGYEAWIVLITQARLGEVVAGFPFDATREGWHPYVLFSSDPSATGELLASAGALDPTDDIVAAGAGVIYWHNRRAVGVDSAFSKLAGKVRYRSTTTNRNLRTLQRLLP